jgi:hypothetical protein
MIGAATLLSILVEPGFFASEPVCTAAVIGAAAAIVSGVVGVFTVIRVNPSPGMPWRMSAAPAAPQHSCSGSIRCSGFSA